MAPCPLSHTSTPATRPATAPAPTPILAPRLLMMRERDRNRKTDLGSEPLKLVSRVFRQILEPLAPHLEGPFPRPRGGFKARGLSSAPPRPCPGKPRQAVDVPRPRVSK